MTAPTSSAANRDEPSSTRHHGPAHSGQASVAQRLRWTLRWTGRTVIALAVILGCLTLPLACSTQIIPPAAPRDAVTVILVDHGDTASLVLPTEDAAMVRYAYGEWQWYALGNTGLKRAIPTLLLPTEGTLGRQEMNGPISKAAVREQMQVGFERLHSVQVERLKATGLRKRLDEWFQPNQSRRVFNRSSDLHFVPHRRRYTYFHNSNHQVAAWLAELGCQVRGPAYASRWHIESQR